MQGQHGFSLSHQHTTLEEFVSAQPGWTLPEHLRFRDGEDEDASGARWDLPDLTRMLEAARNHEFRVLVTPDLDRFARSLVKGLVLEEQLKKYGVRVVYQRVPIEDTPEGRLLKHQLFSFAEYEREKFALRSIMGRRQKARAGQVVGTGTPPTGYCFAYQTLDNGRRRVCGLAPDPIKAPFMRDLLRRLIHDPAPDVARDLNEQGIASPTGRRWNAQTVLKFAHNSVYDGRWVFGRGGNEPITVSVPALLDPGDWGQLQAALCHRQLICPKPETRATIDPFPLRGLLTCGRCHATMQCARNQSIRYYRCGLSHPRLAEKRHRPVCDQPDVPAADLEADLWRVLMRPYLSRRN
jgi:site-specific DNA recombinase